MDKEFCFNISKGSICLSYFDIGKLAGLGIVLFALMSAGTDFKFLAIIIVLFLIAEILLEASNLPRISTSPKYLPGTTRSGPGIRMICTSFPEIREVGQEVLNRTLGIPEVLLTFRNGMFYHNPEVIQYLKHPPRDLIRGGK